MSTAPPPRYDEQGHGGTPLRVPYPTGTIITGNAQISRGGGRVQVLVVGARHTGNDIEEQHQQSSTHPLSHSHQAGGSREYLRGKYEKKYSRNEIEADEPEAKNPKPEPEPQEKPQCRMKPPPAPAFYDSYEYSYEYQRSGGPHPSNSGKRTKSAPRFYKVWESRNVLNAKKVPHARAFGQVGRSNSRVVK